MQAFLVKVLIAVFTSAPVKAMLSQLLQDALDTVVQDLHAKLDKLDADLVTAVEALPGIILGEAAKPVETLLHEITGSTDDIAARVKQDVSPLFDVFEPDTLAQRIVGAMTGGGGQKPPWWPF